MPVVVSTSKIIFPNLKTTRTVRAQMNQKGGVRGRRTSFVFRLLLITVFVHFVFIRRSNRFQQRLRLLAVRNRRGKTYKESRLGS